MKKALLPVLALAIASCGNNGPAFTIKGEFDGLKESELLMYNVSAGHESVDTVKVKNGEFMYRGSTDEPTAYYLVFPNGMEQVIFVDGGDELSYSAKANDLRNYMVEGSKDNEAAYEFHKTVNKLGATEARKNAAQYIKENPQSIVALYAFDRFFVQDGSASAEEVAELLAVLEPHHSQNLHLIAVGGKLSLTGKGEIGSALPDLVVETKKKDSINIAKLKEDYTLVFCWASWQQSPYESLDLMREVREAYGADTLAIVSVSADTKMYRWQEYSRQDSVGIYNCCDLKVWDSPLLKELGVHHIPAYILADSAHRIVSRSYDVSTLKAELKRLIKTKK